jgi:uncharacterized membrane protein HdeD (DUF308 family)
MDTRVTDNWWALALRGVVAIIFGVVALTLTGATLVALVILFAAFLFVTGILGLVAGAIVRSWLLTIEGALGILAGILTFAYPRITVVALGIVIGVWAILAGIAEVWAAVVLRRVIPNEWLLGISGVLSIVFGILVAIFPVSGLVAIVWIIGVYAILWGVLLIALGVRLRSSRGRLVVST